MSADCRKIMRVDSLGKKRQLVSYSGDHKNFSDVYFCTFNAMVNKERTSEGIIRADRCRDVVSVVGNMID